MLGDLKIAFIGGGTMGEMIISRLLSTKTVEKSELIIVSEPYSTRCLYLEKEYGVHTTNCNIEAVQGASIVILAVKPQVLPEVMAVLKDQIPPDALVISIVGGASVSSLCQGLNHGAVVRTMPNIAVQVGHGTTVWSASSNVTEIQRSHTQIILQALGKEFVTQNEHYLDMATALSSAGTGFVFLYIEAMIDAGVQMGLTRIQAQELTLHTIAGSVELMLQTNEHPAVLRNKVTSPGGVTAAGIYELEKGGMRTSISNAFSTALSRTQQLGNISCSISG
ncbi:pyrroline-5-carboxylate reductase [Trichormus variabilis ARAD]|nr:pyrroline-5-carboxylate reductase [Trichormus variabilis ARAD]MBC1254792.1 pyrroline-5-carboxylate reductase [Trichormus variabilis V5]MBC1267566.1 pyrroline-5-carboxylate reductase [Trichormus variabilis FSR]MBC1301080.1 pyrroline-5-carboxylate reductase [Trichormus variabilis N2B]MBC1312637.1 pyrroline-5-carboxylate reductase [Trichormus variabilis PNB]MBC1327961.1 pyrroline-5-carboxylate reductase [Trichormus variabilis 9RC]MBD2381925.1 pyrroline-5-carboxylate reductase [Trichormus vari